MSPSHSHNLANPDSLVSANNTSSHFFGTDTLPAWLQACTDGSASSTRPTPVIVPIGGSNPRRSSRGSAVVVPNPQKKSVPPPQPQPQPQPPRSQQQQKQPFPWSSYNAITNVPTGQNRLFLPTEISTNPLPPPFFPMSFPARSSHHPSQSMNDVIVLSDDDDDIAVPPAVRVISRTSSDVVGPFNSDSGLGPGTSHTHISQLQPQPQPQPPPAPASGPTLPSPVYQLPPSPSSHLVPSINRDTLLTQFNQAVSQLRGKDNGGASSAEAQARINLLHQAADRADTLFLFVHMVMSHAVVIQEHTKIAAALGIDLPTFRSAMAILLQLLPTDTTRFSYNTLAFFSGFPFTPSAGTDRYIHDVGIFMTNLSESWISFRTFASRHGFSPSCGDMADCLYARLQVMAPSALVVHTIFLALFRASWPSDIRPEFLQSARVMCDQSIDRMFTTLLCVGPDMHASHNKTAFQAEYNNAVCVLGDSIIATMTTDQVANVRHHRQKQMLQLGVSPPTTTGSGRGGVGSFSMAPASAAAAVVAAPPPAPRAAPAPATASAPLPTTTPVPSRNTAPARTASQIPNTSLLFPRDGLARQLAVATPVRTSLLQAGLTTPLLLPLGGLAHSTGPQPQTDHFQYVSSVLLQPPPIIRPDPTTRHSKFMQQFHLPNSALTRLAKDIPIPPNMAHQFGLKSSVRLLRDDSIQWRLRLIPVPDQTSINDTVNISQIVNSSSEWPIGAAVLVNNTPIPLRRKLHWGRDLPVDITPHLTSGTNTIEVTIPPPSTALDTHGNRPHAKCYRVAFEEIMIKSRRWIVDKILSNPALIKPSLDIVSHHFKPASSSKANETTDPDDGDIEFVASLSPINLPLVDPITFSGVRLRAGIPVRTRGCVSHLQAFELATFLDSVATTSAAPLQPLDAAQHTGSTDARRLDRWIHKGLVWVNGAHLSLLVRGHLADDSAAGSETAASVLPPIEPNTPTEHNAPTAPMGALPLTPTINGHSTITTTTTTTTNDNTPNTTSGHLAGQQTSNDNHTNAITSSDPSSYPVFPPSSPDNWRCPICRADARPEQLFVDGYVLAILSDMEKRVERAERMAVWNTALLAHNLISASDSALVTVPAKDLVMSQADQVVQFALLREQHSAAPIDIDGSPVESRTRPEISPSSNTAVNSSDNGDTSLNPMTPTNTTKTTTPDTAIVPTLFPLLDTPALSHPWCKARAQAVANGWVGADMDDILTPGLLDGVEALDLNAISEVLPDTIDRGGMNNNEPDNTTASTRLIQRTRVIMDDEDDDDIELGEVRERTGTSPVTHRQRQSTNRAGPREGTTMAAMGALTTADPKSASKKTPRPRFSDDYSDEEEEDDDDDMFPDAVMVQPDGTWVVSGT